MPKIVEFSPHGIKCDMPGCGWRDDTVVWDPKTYGRELLNKPCPQCNGNLYTERDFKLVRRLARTAKVINATFGWLMWFTPKSQHKTETTTLGSDGRGMITEVVGETELARKLREAVAAKADQAEFTLTYTLTKGKLLSFLWTVTFDMDALPRRTRRELFWSAIKSKGVEATGVFRGTKAEVAYIMESLQQAVEEVRDPA